MATVAVETAKTQRRRRHVIRCTRISTRSADEDIQADRQTGKQAEGGKRMGADLLKP